MSNLEENVIFGEKTSELPPEMSLGHLFYNYLKNTANNSKLAIIEAVTGKKYTYQQLFNLSCRLANSLCLNGYGKNAMFSICSENNADFFIPIIASFFICAITSPINPNLTISELTHCLNISRPSVIFCSKLTLAKIIELKKMGNSDFIEKIIVIDSNNEEVVEHCQLLRDFIISDNNSEKIELAKIEDSKKQIAFILYSSGTTDLPKGVMLTHYNVMEKLLHTDSNNLNNVDEFENILGLLPYFHTYGLQINLRGLINNQTVIVLKKFEERFFLHAVSTYKIKHLMLVPPLVVFLAKNPLVESYDLSHVKVISSGAAPCDKQTELLLKKRMKNVTIRQGYGLTETTLAVIGVPYKDSDVVVKKRGSCGVVMKNTAVKIVDLKTGKALGPNKQGEIYVKSLSIMLGYYNNEEATKNAFTSDGWLITGDVGYYDDDKYFYIVDRLKELIKYNGFQVAPAEIEAVLVKHPKIRDAGVVGLAKEGVGEVPVAFVELVAESNLSEKDVEDYVSENVSTHKKLRGGVRFVEKIPRSASGKILRKELRKMLNKE